jgi:iron complex outermembrane recepter protein
LKPNKQLAYAISAALGTFGAHSVHAQQADQTAATSEGIAEVVVTAQRRSESIQDVPITIQAITGQQLEQLNITSTYDLLKYTPNVTYSGNGPGTGNIFVRGLGGNGGGNQSQSSISPFPNVALYLDDQSMQFPFRNNDVYAIDLERVEVLEGPQGTLFGGGAQAGAIRYITNKPNLNTLSGEFNGGYGSTTHGDNNNLVNGVVNIPLIDGTLAARAVFFSEHRGGYIDNVPGTIGFFPGTIPATQGGNPIATNAGLTGDHTNSVDYGGARLSLLWKVNDDWNVLLQQNYQDAEADGYLWAYPNDSNGNPLQPYQLTAFTPAFNKDRYESTAWTVNGNVDNLSVVYTGSYMTRHIESQQDYSNYMRSLHGSYYACIGTGAYYFNAKSFSALKGSPLKCYAPVGGDLDTTQNNHWSHEFRVATPTEYRWRGLAGAYWEKFTIYDQMNFNYLPIPQCDPTNLAEALAGGNACLSAVGPLPGTFASEPGLREGTNTAFGQDLQRGYKQLAFFASTDFDIIPKVLTITGGGRWYRYDEFEYGSRFTTESTSPLILNHPNGACTATGGCGFPINLHKDETGTRWRGNLTWHIVPDMMAYYTFSQGFRPGGFNRTPSIENGPVSPSAEAPYASPGDHTDQIVKPPAWNSDQLINNEIGFKSEFLDHRLLFNVSAYIMHWDNVQLLLFDPVHLGNTTFVLNGPSYTIKGFEVQFVARLIEGLSVEASSSVNSPNQSDAPCLVSVGVLPNNKKTANNPTPAGQCVTQVNGQPYTNPFGALDTRPPYSPALMFNVRARYEWAIENYKPFAWVGASHIGSQSNEPASYPDGDAPTCCIPAGVGNPPTTTYERYEIPGYTTYDGAIGVVKDQWTMQISGSNLSNQYGPTNITSGQYIKAETPLRPRVIMFQAGYKF